MTPPQLKVGSYCLVQQSVTRGRGINRTRSQLWIVAQIVGPAVMDEYDWIIHPGKGRRRQVKTHQLQSLTELERLFYEVGDVYQT